MEPPLPEPQDREAAGERVSLTFSPLHLLSPMFEAQLEVKVVPHFALAAIGGVGSVTAASTDPRIGEQKFSAYELGAQVIGYPLRPFSGLQLGAELLYIAVGTEEFAGQQISANAGGVAVGPLFGYKLVTSVGFTFFVQGGIQYVFVRADAANDQGESVQSDASAVIPLINLNVGWSF